MTAASTTVATDENIDLLIIIASTRPGRVGLPVGEWITGIAEAHGGFNVRVADLATINLPFMNEPVHPVKKQYMFDHTKAWSETVEAADAFLFVMPEYNHSMTAPLKNAIDYLSQEWGYKPVGFVSYGGVSGGLRAVQQVKQAVAALKMTAVSEAVTIPSVTSFVHDGFFAPEERLASAASTMLGQLRRWAIALEPIRNGEIA
ncbi:MAG: NAD(P)H-dependent oxidoreductase [Chloroflexota bacterium]|nr:NAD(P)H-dependent oxidoreductase [Chloroflexota bacterium]